MTETTTLAQLILKEYFRSVTDVDAFEWVALDHLVEFMERILPVDGTPTDLGLWITPFRGEDLKLACWLEIEEADPDYLREAVSIAVMAGWQELGPTIAKSAIEEMCEEQRLSLEATVCVRAAELLGAMNPDLLTKTREVLGLAASGYADLKDCFPDRQHIGTLETKLISIACTLMRHGSDIDGSSIKDLVDNGQMPSSLKLLRALSHSGFDITEYLFALQEMHLPPVMDRTIDVFCDLIAETGVPVNFARRYELDEIGWIEPTFKGHNRRKYIFS